MERKVIVPHIPTRYDQATERRVPSLNLSPAASFGTIVTLLPSEQDVRVTDMQDLIDEVMDAAQAEFRSGDYVCCAGDPLLLAATLYAIAEGNTEHIRILRWDRVKRTYIVSEVKL